MNTVYFLNQIMGNVFKTKTSPALPSEYYLGLSSTEPKEDGTSFTEPLTSGTGYARVKLENLSIPTNGEIKNEAAISFPESTTNWGAMTHYVIFDTRTGGNLLMYGKLAANRNVEVNTVVTVKSESLSLILSNPT